MIFFLSNSDLFAKNHYFVKITILLIFSSNSDFLAKKSLIEKITIIEITVIFSFCDFFYKKNTI